jgi:UDP-glucuronate 4-epimerase
MKILITGTAGFIGFHLAERLLAEGHAVTGFDGVTDYYDPSLKRARLGLLEKSAGFRQVEGMLEDGGLVERTVAECDAEIVIHLAAQAGVRYSIESPGSYIQSNVVGTANLLEALRRTPPRHLVFASTSSVYGGNSKIPFAETDRADGPVSLYAATKKSGEAMVHSYAHLFGFAATSVRFFTVYGPWGRPDMAAFKFTSAILSGKPIDVYGFGKMRRDFTFVDDLVSAIVKLMTTVPSAGQSVGPSDSISPVASYRSVNIAAGRPTELMDFIGCFERAIGKRAEVNLLPMQAGDVVATQSDTQLLRALVGQLPETSVTLGVQRFVEWYRTYYRA